MNDNSENRGLWVFGRLSHRSGWYSSAFSPQMTFHVFTTRICVFFFFDCVSGRMRKWFTKTYGDVKHCSFGDDGSVDDGCFFGDADCEWYRWHYSETFHSVFGV
jgi:hypothetical protein